jgi:hypothetical protein
VEGYRQGTLHAGSRAIAKLAPEKISTMTEAEKKDYQESLDWAHKVSPVLLSPVSVTSYQFSVLGDGVLSRRPKYACLSGRRYVVFRCVLGRERGQ